MADAKQIAIATESNIKIIFRYFRLSFVCLYFDLVIKSCTQLASDHVVCSTIEGEVMANRMLRAIIMGPPGAGKGTISSRISSTFKLTHLSSGDILRSHISNGTPLGKEAERYISDGLLVPDATMVSLILESVAKSGRQQRWLLDGFPRTVQQANALTKHIDVDTVIYLDAPATVIIDRIKGRWIHAASGRVYHDEYNPPTVNGLDDHTGEELSQRPDDHPDTVKERLEQYETQTRPVLNYYKQRNLLQTFSGTESDVIWPQVKKFFQKNFTTTHRKYIENMHKLT